MPTIGSPGTSRGQPRRTAVRFLLGIALLFLVAVSAQARSDRDWSFEVLEVVEGADGHIIRLRPMPPGPKFPRSCKTLVVHSTHDVDDWNDTNREAASLANHRRSLKVLQQAQAVRKIVRFGAIGRGFSASADGSLCEVASRALVYILGSGGTMVVYSLFVEP
jgi:hypothetical protein